MVHVSEFKDWRGASKVWCDARDKIKAGQHVVMCYQGVSCEAKCCFGCCLLPLCERNVCGAGLSNPSLPGPPGVSFRFWNQIAQNISPYYWCAFCVGNFKADQNAFPQTMTNDTEPTIYEGPLAIPVQFLFFAKQRSSMTHVARNACMIFSCCNQESLSEREQLPQYVHRRFLEMGSSDRRM